MTLPILIITISPYAVDWYFSVTIHRDPPNFRAWVRNVSYYFVEADQGLIQRLLWLQFEGYLPEIDGSYDYSSSDEVQMTSMPWKFDADIATTSNDTSKLNPKSDSAQTYALLHKEGYRYQEGKNCITLRLVHLMGEPPVTNL